MKKVLSFFLSFSLLFVMSSTAFAAENTANAKYLGVDLTGYDVHHIIPREYGGTNDYSNLIPLAVSDHRTVTSWWVNY